MIARLIDRWLDRWEARVAAECAAPLPPAPDLSDPTDGDLEW